MASRQQWRLLVASPRGLWGQSCCSGQVQAVGSASCALISKAGAESQPPRELARRRAAASGACAVSRRAGAASRSPRRLPAIEARWVGEVRGPRPGCQAAAERRARRQDCEALTTDLMPPLARAAAQFTGSAGRHGPSGGSSPRLAPGAAAPPHRFADHKKRRRTSASLHLQSQSGAEPLSGQAAASSGSRSLPSMQQGVSRRKLVSL